MADEIYFILICLELKHLFGQSVAFGLRGSTTPDPNLPQQCSIHILSKVFETSLSPFMGGKR